MTLIEQFEKEYFERPAEPYSDNENPQRWSEVLAWTEKYVTWLEEKLTSDNSEYAKSCNNCRIQPQCREQNNAMPCSDKYEFWQ